MVRVIVPYALALGLAATLLAWLEERYLARAFPFELYVSLVAAGAIGLGAWLGRRLTPRRAAAWRFERNAAAVRSLGVTPRELDILDRLASGESNKEIARRSASRRTRSRRTSRGCTRSSPCSGACRRWRKPGTWP